MEPKAFLRPETLILAAAHLRAMPLHMRATFLKPKQVFGISCLHTVEVRQPFRAQLLKGTKPFFVFLCT